MDEQRIPETEQDLSEILKIRRGKLDALVAAGKNPFEKVRYPRTAYSKGIKEDYENYEPSLTITGDTTNAQGTIPTGDGKYSATDNALLTDHTMLTFKNSRTITPTGLFMRYGAPVTALLAGGVLTATVLPKRKRGKTEDEDGLPDDDE